MAGTIEFLGTRITDAESITNWGVSRVDGGGGQSWTNIAVNATENIQGTNCVSAESTANADGKVVFFAYDYNAAVGSNLDFSAGGADEGQLIWMWCKLVAPQPSGDSANSPGISLGLSSAAGTPDDTDTAWWTFYGAENYPGGWVRLVLDPRKRPTASGASFDLSAVQHVGMVGTTQTTKGSVEVGFIDAIDLGSGVRYYGNNTDDSFDELIAADQDDTNNKYGVVETLEPTDTVVQLRGILEIGSGNSPTNFISNDKIVVFDSPQYISDVQTFVNAIEDDFPKIVIAESDTAYTSGIFGTKVGTGDDAAGRGGVQFIANSNYDYNFIIESGVDTVRMYGSTIKGFNDKPLVWSGDATYEFAGSFFDNNGQIEFVDKNMVIRNCTFLNASGDSALLWTSGMDIKNCSFIGNRNTATNNGAGIEHDEEPIVQIYDGLTFADNDFDIYFSPTSSGDLTINATNGSDPVTIRRGFATSTVDIINTITLTLENIVADAVSDLTSEVRIFTAGTTTEIAGTENVAVTGNSRGKFEFSFEGGDPNVDIRIFNLNYQPVDLLNFQLPGVNSSQLIQQIFDRNYENPEG